MSTTLEETLLEIIRHAVRYDREASRLTRDLRRGVTGPRAYTFSLGEMCDVDEQVKANLGEDPTPDLLNSLSWEDLRKIEVLAYAGALKMSLADTVPCVPKDPEHVIIARLAGKPLDVDLIRGWAQAIKDGYRDLAEWDPDNMPEHEPDEDEDDDDD